MQSTKPRFRLSFNAPVILTFLLICVVAQVLNIVTAGQTNRLLFSVYRSSLIHPLTWLRCVAHVFGHADWNHLIGNMMYILILGPMLEEKYGSSNITFVMLATAIVTGLVNMVFFPRVALLYIGQQVYEGLFVADNVSQLGHIIGGVVGSALGFVMKKHKMDRYQR